ncbi:MAG: M15 family metallopeptidase [Ilumatobacteraceae bacterium]
MASFQQGHLTTDPETLDVEWLEILPIGDPIANIVEPEEFTPVLSDCREELVDISTSFNCAQAYFDAGWQHSTKQTYLRSGIAQRLHNVNASLPEGFSIFVFDGWRPLALQSELFEAAYGDANLPPGFLAEPSKEISLPSPHVSGGTVDLTLSYRDTPLGLGTSFDNFDDDAAIMAFEHTDSIVRRLRRLLYSSMRRQEFIVYSGEWWHFEYGTPRWAAISGLPGCYQIAEFPDGHSGGNEAPQGESP